MLKAAYCCSNKHKMGLTCDVALQGEEMRGQVQPLDLGPSKSVRNTVCAQASSAGSIYNALYCCTLLLTVILKQQSMTS